MRQQAIRAVREGQTATSVAAAFGLNVRTVFNWLAKFSDGGKEALLAKPILGCPIGGDEEMRWVAHAVRNHTPQQFGFDDVLQTLSLIAQLIDHQVGKSFSLAAVSLIMKLLSRRLYGRLLECKL
jgi:transposase